MKKYISVLAIIFIISLAACSNQTISSTPTGNESNIQSNSITTLDKGIWPVNEYTEGLPIPPGTVAWATLDTEHENCSVNLTGISDDDYSEYMEVLNQEGFSVIENVSEEIEEGNYVSIGTLLSNEDKWLSISYIPDSLTIVKAKLFCPEIAGLFCRIAGLFCHDSRANLSLKPVCFGIAIS